MFSSIQDSKTVSKPFSRKGTFADLLVRYVRESGADAPSVYTAARIDRRTYSAIISRPFRPVAKRTAVQFAIALRLDRTEADALLRAAGFALSPVIPEDIIFAEAIESRTGDLDTVSLRLYELGKRVV